VPVINQDTCVRCGDCLRICASSAISSSGGGKEQNESPSGAKTDRPLRMDIDYSRCILCFCCHEICPVKAIDIAKRRSRVVH